MYLKQSKKGLFLFNSVTGVAQLLLNIIIVFFSVRVFFKYLGEEQYGIFSVVTVIGSITNFANFSLNSTLIKFISEQGRTQESNYDILTVCSILVLVLIPITILIYLFRSFILLSVLKVPVEYLAASCTLLKYLLVANVFLLVGKNLTAILDANHKIYLTNFYLFLYSVIYWGSIITIILLGYGLEYLGIAVCFSAIFWFFMVLFSSLKIWGKIHIGQLRQNFVRVAKKHLTYSMKIYTGSVLGFLYEPLTRILISNLIGVSYAGFYDITLKVKSNIIAVFFKLLYPISPMIAHEDDKKKLGMIVKNTSKALFYLIIPVIVILLVCTRQIITLWIGDNVELISISTTILVSLSLLTVTTVTPIYIFLRLKNHPEKEIYIQASNAIVNMIVILLTFSTLGYYSVVLGNTISYLLPFILCIYYQKKYLDFYPFSGAKEIAKYAGVLFFITLSTALFSLLFTGVSWFNVIVISIFACVVSFFTFYFGGVLKSDEMSFLFNDKVKGLKFISNFLKK